MRIGFIGLGDMGLGIVPRLLAAGHVVSGWNRPESKAAPLIEQGMIWAGTRGCRPPTGGHRGRPRRQHLPSRSGTRSARPFAVDGTVAGLRARITKNGSEMADTEDLEALTGGIASILGHVAGLLLASGERLRAGEVVIAGSVVPPIPIRMGDEVTFELVPLPAISVKV